MYLIDKIPVYVINLKDRADRKAHIAAEFSNKPCFEVRFVDAVKHETGAIGLWQSILGCVRSGMEREEELIVICEDDHMFSAGFNEAVLRSAISEARGAGADVLLGGVSWVHDAVFTSETLVRIKAFSGTQFAILFKHTFGTILQTPFAAHNTADGVLGDIFENNYLMHPMISVQKDFGYSDATPKNNEPGRVDSLFETSACVMDVLKNIRSYYGKSHADHQLADSLGIDTITIPTYVINLPERKDRLAHALRQFEGKPEFDVAVVEAVRHPVGALGLWLSIRKVIEMAIGNDDDVIVICEDDHVFTPAYEKASFIRNVVLAPQLGIEYLSGGCSYFGHAVPVTPGLYWVNLFQATQFIVLYRPAFEKILLEPFDDTVVADLRLSEMLSNKMVLYPAISTQQDFGYSDVTPVHNEQKNLVANMFKRANIRLDRISRIAEAHGAYCIPHPGKTGA